MLRTISLLSLGLFIGFITSAYAQDPPALSDSEIQTTLNRLTLEEGTEIKLDPETISELTPWMKNSKLALEDLLERTSTLRPALAKDTLVHSIKTAVLESAPKRTELLMRYVLNRALKVIELMDQYSSVHVPGVLTQQVRVLRRSIEFALKYYSDDLKFLTTSTPEESQATLPLAQFGVEYARFLFDINESQINARAQYAVGLFAIGLLHVDLARDTQSKVFAAAIEKIRAFLLTSPSTPPAQDSDAIALMRGIRQLYQSTFHFLSPLKDSGKNPLFPQLKTSEAIIKSPNPTSSTPPAAKVKYSDVYESILGFTSRFSSDYIEHAAASEIAKQVVQGKLDLQTFKKVYYRVTNVRLSIQISKEIRAGQFDFAVFEKALETRATYGDWIDFEQASTLARLLASEPGFDLETFFRIFKKTSNFNESLRITRGKF